MMRVVPHPFLMSSHTQTFGRATKQRFFDYNMLQDHLLIFLFCFASNIWNPLRQVLLGGREFTISSHLIRIYLYILFMI